MRFVCGHSYVEAHSCVREPKARGWTRDLEPPIECTVTMAVWYLCPSTCLTLKKPISYISGTHSLSFHISRLSRCTASVSPETIRRWYPSFHHSHTPKKNQLKLGAKWHVCKKCEMLTVNNNSCHIAKPLWKVSKWDKITEILCN